MITMFSNPAPTNYVWQPLFRHMDEMLDVLSALHADRKDPLIATPRCDFQETEDLYVMNFDIPGVKREDLVIELVGNRLQIAGERKFETSGNRRPTVFRQNIELPTGIQLEHVVADLTDGVLKLAVQKPVSIKPTKIKVGDGTAKGFLKNLLGTDKKIEVKKTTTETAEVVAG